jgi:hypothetical protein
VVCLLRSWEGRFQELQVRNIATVFGRRPRDWRELWTQSVPALTEITSVDWAPEAPSLLNANGLSVKGSSAAMRSAFCGRSPFSATLARCSAASGSASRPDEFARALLQCLRPVWLPDSWRAFGNAITKQAVCGRAKGSRNVELEENVARERTRASWGAVATAVLFTVSGAGAQTPPLDREVKATPGREVRVGIYTSMRADCTAGPLPAIRLSVAPEHGAVTVRRATLKATNVK